MVKLTMRLVLAPALFLAGALTIHAAGEPGIIKGADEFEFVYRVKLPEITGVRSHLDTAREDRFFSNRECGKTEHPDEMGQGSGPRLRQ